MRNLLSLSLLIGITAFIFSCKKKEYTCEHSIFYRSVSVVFKGFTSSDLQKVVINKYQPNGQFNQLLSSDTADYSTASFRGDTAYAQDQYPRIGFFQLLGGNDYTVTVLSTNNIFKISDIKDGEPTASWTQDHECSMGAYQAEISAELLKLNGQPANVFYFDVNWFLVCLVH